MEPKKLLTDFTGFFATAFFAFFKSEPSAKPPFRCLQKKKRPLVRFGSSHNWSNLCNKMIRAFNLHVWDLAGILDIVGVNREKINTAGLLPLSESSGFERGDSSSSKVSALLFLRFLLLHLFPLFFGNSTEIVEQAKMYMS